MRALFPRPVETLGIAPLTSMYWYGEANSEPRTDWRPEVHDSDGLAIWTGAGERIWRPLNNPPRVTTNAYLDRDPKGFGLIQRDRAFSNYEDDGVFYEKRPSLWVEPLSAFGPGSVRLVELKTIDETNDNIVAFWTPEAKIVAGSTVSARYRLNWTLDAPAAPGGRRIVATRIGQGGKPGLPPTPGSRRFVIDVEGEALKGLGVESGVKAVVSASNGKIGEVAAYPINGTDRWRMLFDLDGVTQPSDLRAFLQRNGEALSETWLYQAFPPASSSRRRGSCPWRAGGQPRARPRPTSARPTGRPAPVRNPGRPGAACCSWVATPSAMMVRSSPWPMPISALTITAAWRSWVMAAT